MSTHHLHRKIKRTPEEVARLRADRERYQRERPTPQQLLAEGGHKEFVKLGELLMLHQAVAWLKQERERQNLTLAEISERTGIDQAALSRLETGKNSNPTLDTLYRVAAALGKTIHFSFRGDDMTPQSPTLKLHSRFLNPFQPFTERDRDNESKERLRPAIENNMSRAVFSALAHAEGPNAALAGFVEELAKNPQNGSGLLCDKLQNLAADLRRTDPSKIEIDLQSWPGDDAVKERLGENVYLLGISYSSAWTHDKRHRGDFQVPDAWIYIPGKMLLVFEFKKDEYPLDATQVSEYVHKLIPGVEGVQRAMLGSTLSKEEAQDVQKKCKDKALVVDADWSAVIAALQHIQKDARVGSRGRWLAGQAERYIQWHIRPPYRGLQTILDWLNGPDTPDRREYLRTLVTEMGEALKKSANGFPGAITFAEDDRKGGCKMRGGAGSALYVKLKQNGRLLSLPWLGDSVRMVLWFAFNEVEPERIGLEYYLQARGAAPSQGGGKDKVNAWNEASARHLIRAKDFEDKMAAWASKAPEGTLVDVSTLQFEGKKSNWHGRGGVKASDGPKLSRATPKGALEFIRANQPELWRFPRVGPGEVCATVEEAQKQVRKPALALIEPLETSALAACGEDGRALQEFLRKVVEKIIAKTAPN